MGAAEVTGQRDLPGQIYRGTHSHFDIFIAHGEIPFPGVELRIFVKPASRNQTSRRGIRPCGVPFRNSRRGVGCQLQRRAGAVPCCHKTGDRTSLAARDRTDAAVCLPLPLNKLRRCRRLRVPQPGFPQGYAVLRCMLLLPDFLLPWYSPFVLCRTVSGCAVICLLYCNGSANK